MKANDNMQNCKDCNYSDEFCASGDCPNDTNVAQSNSQNLTEQWKKGELPEDAYYVTYYKNDTPEVDIYRRVYSLYDDSEVRFTIPQVDKVLAPVPSYEEWQKLKLHDEKATIKLGEVCIENLKLKELLKRCRDFINYEVPDHCIDDVLIDKIDNAIGEKSEC